MEDYRTPEWKEPECFEGHLNEQQLSKLEHTDEKRELKTALMLSQLSQAVDFCIGWAKALALSGRQLEKDQRELKNKVDKEVQHSFEEQDRRIIRIEAKMLVGQWAAGIVVGAILVEVVRKWFR